MQVLGQAELCGTRPCSQILQQSNNSARLWQGPLLQQFRESKASESEVGQGMGALERWEELLTCFCT